MRASVTSGGTGGGGWVHLKGADSMAVSGYGCRMSLVGTRSSVIFWLLETSHLSLWGLHFQHSMHIFQLCQVGISQEP